MFVIKDKLETLIKHFTQLSSQNMDFYRSKGETDEFVKLIDERALIIDKTEEIIGELRNMFSELLPEQDFNGKNLINMLMIVATKKPEMAVSMQEISNSLKELMETDRLVSKKIATFQAKLKSDIAKTRNESKSIQGYKQLDTYGSCFINKIK